MLFLVCRFGELIYRDKLHHIFNTDFYAMMFWIETALMVFPLVIFRMPSLRNDSRWLYASGLSMLIGAAMWRMSYSLVASNPGADTTTSQQQKNFNFNRFRGNEVCAYILLIRLLPVIQH